MLTCALNVYYIFRWFAVRPTLGIYGEKHPERGDDSFNNFDELMGIGVEQRVDMVILGGDLFHENKPSR